MRRWSVLLRGFCTLSCYVQTLDINYVKPLSAANITCITLTIIRSNALSAAHACTEHMHIHYKQGNVVRRYESAIL